MRELKPTFTEAQFTGGTVKRRRATGDGNYGVMAVFI